MLTGSSAPAGRDVATVPVSVPKLEDAIFKPETFDDLKKRCADIGFEPGTEKFGDCVMRLMEYP